MGGTQALFFDNRVNGIKNGFQLLLDLVGPKAKLTVTVASEPRRAFCIMRSLWLQPMLKTIDFNDQLQAMRYEIGAIRTDWRLPAEMRSLNRDAP